MRFWFIISAFFTFVGNAQQPLPAIGLWREHLPYNSAIDLAASNDRIFCATPYSLYSVTKTDKTIERYSRVTGLSETGISTIAYDDASQKLVIAYANSNVDILYRNDIYNIPDIKRSTIAGDKTIYAIQPIGQNYYLSTGLGVIVLDGDRYEVKDSWFIGQGGNPVKVQGFASDGIFYYAATDEGLKKAAVNSPNLANHLSWQLIGANEGLAPGACQNVLSVTNKIIVQKNDSLFVQNGTSWSFFYSDGWQIINSHSSNGKLMLCERLVNGDSRVRVLNMSAAVEKTLAQPSVISFPRKAIHITDTVWIADQFGGLSYFVNGSFEQFKPNSPESVSSGEMTVYKNVFYATAGSVNDAWNYLNNSNGIFIFKQGEWTNINRFRYQAIDSLLDYITITIDPRDETIWTGSFGGGLLHIKPGPVFEIFKQGFLGAMIGDPGSYRVSGLQFDREQNLWIANYGSPQPLRVRKADGNWINFSIPFLLDENAVSQIVIDDNNYKWIVSPRGNGLICFDHGNALENTGDDRWRLFRAGAGNGNLPANEVNCVAKDKSGFIWVGTSDGVGVIQCPQEAFVANTCEAVWPIVQQGSFANYLFKGEEVRDIAVDGADRKWVATRNGVWLINASGEKIVYQFTETNSPLLSNDVKKITIDPSTGEVYFATLKGICSFRSTATEGEVSNNNVLVFPNPVPPNYSGTIAIRGLVNNAIVKIVEMNGRMIYQARALGGQMVWNGRDYQGRNIASGVYLVLVSDDGRTEKTAAKIVFVK